MIAIIQARLGSTRFPKKILADLGGRPVLAHVVERVKAIKSVVRVVVACPAAEVKEMAAALGPDVTVCGPKDIAETNVLARFVAIAQQYPVEAYLRVTGDCPLLAPDVAEAVLARFLAEDADYAWNDTTTSGYPDGCDVEVFTRALLERAASQATTAYDREHVTPIMRMLPGVKVTTLRSLQDYSALKLSVDTPADLDRVRAIVAQLAPGAFDLRATVAAAKKAGV